MNFDNDNDMWDWQCLEDSSSIDISKCLLDEVNQNEDFSYVFEDETTPVKACGDLSYNVPSCGATGKELEQPKEPSSQVKRRRMLQFESEVLDAPLGDDDAFLRSNETSDSLEEALSEMTQWVSGFSEGTSTSSNDHFEALDQSSERWLADCFNDAEIHFSGEDICATGTSNVQTDVREIFNNPSLPEANQVPKLPVRTRRNVVFKGRKSYIRTPPKLASSVAYPFAFIKPCGVLGDVTLKDINRRIHMAPSEKQNNEDDAGYPTSAFSGKPVVGRTKIRTEGGKGSITIMRTKG